MLKNGVSLSGSSGIEKLQILFSPSYLSVFCDHEIALI